MRVIDRQSAFKRDFKREKLSGKHQNFVDMVGDALRFLITDTPLPEGYNDHALTGNWAGFCECHIKPDLLLIYEKIGLDVLMWCGLARIAGCSVDYLPRINILSSSARLI